MSASAKLEAAPAGDAAVPLIAQPKSGGSMLPVILVVVLVPALCFGVTNFVLLPKLKASIMAESGAGEGTAKTGAKQESGEGHGAKSEGHGAKSDGHSAKAESRTKEAGKGNEKTTEFGMTVVNLAGAMGQRYLRTNFVLAGSDGKLEEIIKENQSALRDVAISVLSSQSLAALETPGAKNLVRNELITQFNRTLGAEVVEQLYFSEFVVQ